MLRLGATPGAEAVLRDVRDAGGDRRARVAAAQRLPADPHRALRRRAHAGDRLGELALAVAGHAGDGDDLARTHDERGALHRRLAAVALRPDALELEHRLAGGPRPGLARRPPSSRPTISAASERGVASAVVARFRASARRAAPSPGRRPPSPRAACAR